MWKLISMGIYWKANCLNTRQHIDMFLATKSHLPIATVIPSMYITSLVDYAIINTRTTYNPDKIMRFDKNQKTI